MVVLNQCLCEWMDKKETVKHFKEPKSKGFV